ncbi:MAG TPA: DinB family protein [Bryobacteraceae bacterium]|nr:DinB family protein [Bryobacteraceae bacterium]
MTIKDALLPEFDQEMANTRKTLERVPEDKFAWKPHPKSFSMISLATHIANMTGWTVETMTKDSFDISPPGAPPYKEEPAASRAQLLEKFDKSVTAARAALAGATDEAYLKNWSLLAGGQTLFTMPRFNCIRAFVMNHVIHHRAQLGVYLRLNDIPVPSIYGPSADEGNM